MRFHRSFADIPLPGVLTIEGDPIVLQSYARDLGVEIDCGLKFHKHIVQTAAKESGCI